MTIHSLPIAPHKTEVIPIHASDRGTFKRCRRRWHWSSPMRENLTQKVGEGAISMPLWYGSGVHWALSQYYDPMLQRDLLETFLTWWDIQWNGGVISEDWLSTTYDRNPVKRLLSGALDLGAEEQVYEYRVKGLREMLYDPQLEEFEEHRELGIGMLTYYKEYAAEHDNFDVIAAEHTFSVPVLDDKGNDLLWIDHRDGVEKPVHLRGTQDAIIQDRESGKYGILEHKTAVSISEDYFLKLDKDEQCTTYMYAGEREAEEFDMPYKKIDFVLYNALRKAYPKPPTMLKNGMFSMNKAQESTTPRLLKEFIEQNALGMIVAVDPKAQAYIDYVERQGSAQFIQRDLVRRNRAEIRSCGSRVYWEVLDMLDEPKLYPNPTGDWMCLRCPFRAPCIAVDDGSDYETMLDDMFEKNWTR